MVPPDPHRKTSRDPKVIVFVASLVLLGLATAVFLKVRSWREDELARVRVNLEEFKIAKDEFDRAFLRAQSAREEEEKKKDAEDPGRKERKKKEEEENHRKYGRKFAGAIAYRSEPDRLAPYVVIIDVTIEREKCMRVVALYRDSLTEDEKSQLAKDVEALKGGNDPGLAEMRQAPSKTIRDSLWLKAENDLLQRFSESSGVLSVGLRFNALKEFEALSAAARDSAEAEALVKWDAEHPVK